MLYILPIQDVFLVAHIKTGYEMSQSEFVLNFPLASLHLCTDWRMQAAAPPSPSELAV